MLLVFLWTLSPISYIEITLGRDLLTASMNRKNDYSKIVPMYMWAQGDCFKTDLKKCQHIH